MKPILAILALFTITLHVVAGGVGSIIICSHLNGDSHPIVTENHSDSEDCCDHGIVPSDEECNSCVDTKIEAGDLAKVPSQSERNLLKGPVTQVDEMVQFEDLLPVKLSNLASRQLSRAPPPPASGIAPHIKITVLRV